MSLPEMYSRAALRPHAGNASPHELNSEIIVEAICASIQQHHQSRRAANYRSPVVAPPELQQRLDGLRSRATCISELQKLHAGVSASQEDAATVKRRRLTRKDSVLDSVTKVVQYHWNHDWRCRRYATTMPAAQSMDHQLQELVLRNTVYLEVRNSLPTLLYQSLQRSDLIDRESLDEELQLLFRMHTDFEKACRDEFEMSTSKGM